jgi:hypothetical protein
MKGDAPMQEEKDPEEQAPEAKRAPRTNTDLESLRILMELAKNRSQGSPTYRLAILMGIAIGGVFALAGFVLCLLGLSGSIEWLVEGASLKAKLTNASPGIVFAGMGMIIIWRYKPVVHDHLRLGDLSSRIDAWLSPEEFDHDVTE